MLFLRPFFSLLFCFFGLQGGGVGEVVDGGLGFVREDGGGNG